MFGVSVFSALGWGPGRQGDDIKNEFESHAKLEAGDLRPEEMTAIIKVFVVSNTNHLAVISHQDTSLPQPTSYGPVPLERITVNRIMIFIKFCSPFKATQHLLSFPVTDVTDGLEPVFLSSTISPPTHL